VQYSVTVSGMKMENGYDQQSSGGGAVKNTTTYGGGQARTYAAPYSASGMFTSSICMFDYSNTVRCHSK